MVFKGLVLVSGTWVKHSTAHPCPWPCQPRRKEADVSAFVHFISVYEHSSSLLASSSRAQSCPSSMDVAT